MNEKPVYLTREGRDKLQAELDKLIRVSRVEVAGRIAQAKDLGDLSENAEYESAKHEQAFIEGRIREIQHQLSNAQLIDEGINGEKEIRIGSTVTVREEDGEEITYMIVGSAEAKPREGKISNESPVGKALLGKKASKKPLVVETPSGSYKLTIVKIR
ncbi:MAG TPA: transcription elongation factor GreA [Herpetosiphonaceae bacterium]|nr:transcription elongation factor GreA [Herpetosiphonaceae bacterium]